MNDDQHLLASRYLDDDLSADERAAVDADADVLAAVEQMRTVRAALADVPPPADERREAAIAAALAAFEAPVASNVVPLARRRTPRWLMPAAAAVVAVLALGGLAALLGDGDGDSDDSAADMTAAEMTAAGGAGTEAPAGTSQVLAELAPADTAGAATAMTRAEDAAATSVPGSIATAAPTFALAVLDSPEQLTDFAREGAGDSADTMQRAERRLASAAEDCDLGQVVGLVYYLVDDVETLVAVVTADDEVLAVDATCDVVARASLP
jgi:hypothetical protein